MAETFGDRLAGVFLEVVRPELWPRNNRTNEKFVYDFLVTLREDVANSSFLGIYTNKSSFSNIVGPYWHRRKNADLRLWLPNHEVTIGSLSDL